MIMLLMHQPELSMSLQGDGHLGAMPRYREDMVTVLDRSKADLIVLDLFMEHPSGSKI